MVIAQKCRYQNNVQPNWTSGSFVCFFFSPLPTGETVSSLYLHKLRKSSALEVHGAVGQTVPAANVGNLLGLHGLQLGAFSDTMTQTTTESTASLSWGKMEEKTAVSFTLRGLYLGILKGCVQTKLHHL